MISLLLSLQFIACSGCNNSKPIDTGSIENDPIPFTNNWGQWMDMGQLSDGSAAISYYDSTQGAVGLAVGRNDNSTWLHQGIDGYPNEQGLDEGDRGKYTALAVADDGQVWVVYYDVGLRTLRYGSKKVDTESPQDGDWTVGVADTGSGGTPDAGLYPAISLDSLSNPVISHYDNFRNTLRTVHWDGASFSAEVVDEGTDGTDQAGETVDANVGEFSAIAIDQDVEYITYYDRANGALKMAWGTAGAYTIETVDSGLETILNEDGTTTENDSDVGQWTSIAVSDGLFYIAYQDATNNAVKLASGRPGNWTFEVVDSGNLIGADTAIAIREGNIFVGYQDGYTQDLKLAVRQGDSWSRSSVLTEGAVGFHNNLMIDASGLYISSYDFGSERAIFQISPQ